MKSKATGCGSISTVFSSVVLLCVSSIIIVVVVVLVLVLVVVVVVVVVITTSSERLLLPEGYFWRNALHIFKYKKNFYKKMSLKKPKTLRNLTYMPDLQFLKTLIFPRAL